MPKAASKAAKRPARKPPAKKGKVKRAAADKDAAPAEKRARKKSAAQRPRKTRQTEPNGTAALARAVLDDMKALDVRTLDVRHLTSVTDTMIVAAGRSDRHVRAIADALVERCKAAGVRPLGVEGQDGGEWVLVDLADVVVHVMLPRVREFYNIESLWEISARAAGAEQ